MHAKYMYVEIQSTLDSHKAKVHSKLLISEVNFLVSENLL